MTTSSKQNYTLPIVMMFALFFMISFVTGLQNPFGVIVKDQFQASNFMSQLGNAANFIAYAFMGIPSGILLGKIGYKKTALLAIAVGFTGVCISFLSGIAESFAVYLVGAFVSGFSMCLLNAVVNPMLNSLGGGGNRGNQLLMWGGSINSIGATITPVLAGMLIGSAANKTATIADVNPALWIAMGIFALAFIVLSVVQIPEPFTAEADAPKAELKTKDKHSALSFRHFTLGALAIFAYMGLEIGVPNFVNLFLGEATANGGYGMDKSAAGLICGTYWFCMLLGRVGGGVLASKFSSRNMLTAVSVLGVVLVCGAILCPTSVVVNMPIFVSDPTFGFAFAEVPLGVMLLIITGFCTSVMWGSIFNLAVEGLGKYTSMASGIFMVMVCGGGILPLIQGAIVDQFGYMISFGLLAILYAYTLYYALVGSKNVNTDIPVE
ncbi:MAG: MFS transporter [Rikenellaceae bacterium]